MSEKKGTLGTGKKSPEFMVERHTVYSGKIYINIFGERNSREKLIYTCLYTYIKEREN